MIRPILYDLAIKRRELYDRDSESVRQRNLVTIDEVVSDAADALVLGLANGDD